MSDKPERKKARWVIRIEIVAVALLLYVLSIGPVYWIGWKAPVSYPTRQAIDAAVYGPLWWAAGHCQPFERLLQQYVAFWARLAS
jgi:hypothetical protein